MRGASWRAETGCHAGWLRGSFPMTRRQDRHLGLCLPPLLQEDWWRPCPAPTPPVRSLQALRWPGAARGERQHFIWRWGLAWLSSWGDGGWRTHFLWLRRLGEAWRSLCLCLLLPHISRPRVPSEGPLDSSFCVVEHSWHPFENEPRPSELMLLGVT